MKTFLLLAIALLTAGIPVRAESENSQQIADRYELMLLRAPQPGTAFDKVVEWYSGEGGGLEVLRDRWAKSAKAQPDTESQYLILQGLLAERLRSPDNARTFYRNAMQTASDPAAAAKLLAALETTEGKFPAAVEAYKTALASGSLLPLNRMEIMRSLALLYQRSFEDDKAGEVWKDALKRFPDDPYVLEEAGEAFLAGNDYASARNAFAHLQEISKKDPFRKVAATLRLARTEELEGNTAEAVKIYEMALEETSAGSWINREVRARIEELFRRKDDLPGLLAYYDRRTTAVPQDYLAVAAQAAVLDDLGRGAESVDRLRAATKLAPGDLSLRLKLIKQLESQSKIGDAVAEARELAKPADAPPEVLLMLGELLWKDRENNPALRAEALDAWKRLAPPDSADPSRISLLAETLAAKGEADAAILEWKRLIAVTPSASDARQQLARIYIQKEDKPAAASTLAGLVEGDLAKPENFLTLARIQAKLGWQEEARATVKTALGKYPTDPEVLNFAWRQALEANDATAATELLPAVWKASSNDFFAEDIVKRHVSFLESCGTDKEVLDALAAKSDPGEMDAAILLRLAISRKDAGIAGKALGLLKPLSTPVRYARAASVFAEAFGTKEEQVEALKAVAAADPRMSAESLKTAAKLLSESGKGDEALVTITQLIERAPADGSLYGLYADVASRNGKIDEATKRLRDGVRYAEDPSALRMQLATFLQAQSRTQEAAKALQEAFESEQREGRRTEIFRRQIELAMQTGTVDDLIASLKERQSREQGGARYGTYLAEIFLLQGDFLGAREELAKSLGHNPDNAAAVSKLMDLADRGGDQAEALRMAARLVELEPSRTNRSNYITRLFSCGEPVKGLEELEKVRAEILKDPTDWNTALMAMRKAGYSKVADAIVEEIASEKSTDVMQLSEIARLRLSQLNISAAQEVLWNIVATGNFADSLEAVISQPPVQSAFAGYPSPSWARFQSLGSISSEIQNSLQMMFQQYRGGYFQRSFSMGMLPANSQQVAPEQRAVVRAFLLLFHLARSQGQEKEFTRRSAEFLKPSNLSPTAEFVLYSTLNDQDALKALLHRRAGQESADIETDRLFLSSQLSDLADSKEDLDVLRARVEKADPEFAFSQELSRLMSGLRQAEQTPEGRKAATLAGIKKLRANPAAEKSPAAMLQLATVAASAGDLDLAYDIYDSVNNAPARKDATTQASAILDQQLAATGVTLMQQGIASKDKRASEAFEKFLADPSASSSATPNMYLRRFYSGGMGRGTNLLLQESPDLSVGDSEFPVLTFRSLFPMGFPSPEGDKIRAWFSERAKGGDLSPYVLGLTYCEWFSGKKEEALKRIEAIHQSNPTPRSAALLLEIYEKLKSTEKALGLIDLANLQKSETPDIRALRKIRLLRAAGKIQEAKEAAEKLAKGRLAADVRESLRNLLSQLGVPTNQYPGLTNSRSSSVSRDRGEVIRKQMSKLISEQKTAEAERMALMILQNPLPTRDDYQSTNIRRVLLDSLRSIKALDKLQAELEQKLAADPEDFDTAVRLMEIDVMGEGRKSKDRISGIIASHPERVSGIGYAIQLLQNNQSSMKGLAASVICGLIRSNPDILYKSGFMLEEVINFSSEPESGVLLAETVAGLDDSAYDRLFLPTRLMGRMFEAPFLSQLAEFCVQAEKLDSAILLLKRSQDAALANLDSGLMTVLRLAELQLQIGDKEGAAATMNALLKTKSPSRYFGMMSGRQGLSSILLGMMMNRNPGQGASNQLERLSKIATETGTLDALIETLDKESADAKGVTPSLILKTSLGRPGIAAEWRKVAMDESIPLGFFNLQMLSPVLKSLSGQKDAAKLIPALLRRFPEQQYNSGGDSALAALSENLPALLPYAKDPAVKKHIGLLITQAMRDPNASQYLIHYPAYPQALSTLIEHGYYQEARTLLDFTSAARTSRNYGNAATFSMLAARLDAAEGLDTNYQILCATREGPDKKAGVFWKVSPAIPDLPNNGDRVGPAWDTGALPIPEKQRPVSLEIFAGPNPASLSPVAKTSKPGLSGFLPVVLPGNFGLLQARWKLPDGTQKWGALTAYVQGENLIRNAGLPEAGKATGTAGFQTAQPGPLGEKSAVKFEMMLPRPEHKLPLGETALDGTPQLLVMTGWLQGSPGSGQLPQIELRMPQENGSDNQSSIYAQQAGPGQWRQFVRVWSVACQFPGAESLSKETRKMIATMELRANTGYNSQWQVSGAWDGIGMYRFKPEEQKESLDVVLNRSRKFASEKNYAAATDDLLAALHLNPRRVLEQDATNLYGTFEKADRLGDLYTFLSEPALYLPDPLNNYSNTITNESLIGILARGALAEKAPPSAAIWLRQVKAAPLSDNMRFLIEAGILREEAKLDSSKATPERVLELLGFRKDKVIEDRIRSTWSNSSQPTLELLALLGTPEKAAGARSILASAPVQTSLLAAQRAIDAWLLAPTDPAQALKLWSESLALRSSGENSVSFNSETDKAIFNRIAQTHQTPGDIVAAVKNWVSSMRNGPEYEKRMLAENLYFLAKQDTPQKATYMKAWADAETASLRLPNFSASRERILELANYLREAAEWDRLFAMLDVAKSHSSLQMKPFQQELARIRNAADFAKGDYSNAWPVAWCRSADGAGKISWQWNAKLIDQSAGTFDMAVAVAAKPILETIAKQSGMEFLFGELPDKLSVVARIEGTSASGSVEASLPAGNGFLQAVAIVDGKRVPGPLLPVVSGKRIFPAADATLKDMLQTGPKPLSTQSLFDAEAAPDGTPALRIGQAGSKDRCTFNGPQYPLQPGKLYVMRAWLRRAGEGTGTLTGILRSSNMQNRVSPGINLTERSESNTCWILYTRAVPIIAGHTANLPYREVESISPRAYEIWPGTEIAGWELLEVEDSKYGAWLKETASVREAANDAVTPELVDKLMDLAAFEPNTALEHHGDWLTENLAKSSRPENILASYRNALDSAPNPLFPRRNLWNITGSLLAVADNHKLPESLRWEATELALSKSDLLAIPRLLAFQRCHVELAIFHNREQEIRQQITDGIVRQLADPQRKFINSTLENQFYVDDRPSSEFLRLMDAMGDAASLKRILQELNGESGKSLQPYHREFALLAIELCIAGTKPDQAWSGRVDKAFDSIGKGAPANSNYWPMLLADLMISKHVDPAITLHLQEKGIERLLGDQSQQNSYTKQELLRATTALVENCLKTGNSSALKSNLDRVLAGVTANKNNTNERSLQMALNILDQLTAAGQNELAAEVLKTVEKDVRRSSTMLTAYSKYLPAPNQTPSLQNP